MFMEEKVLLVKFDFTSKEHDESGHLKQSELHLRTVDCLSFHAVKEVVRQPPGSCNLVLI